MSPPDPPKRPRQPSQPDIQGIAVDKLVGRATDMVGATTRKQTFTGLGAMKPPPLPGELAPTLKAPPNPLQHKTVRAPSPPPLVAASRRTPVPPKGESPAPTDAATERPEPSLPTAGRIPMSPPIRSASPSPDSGSLPPRKPTRTGGDDGGALTNHRLDMLERGQERSERATGRMTGQLTAVEMAVANLAQEVKLGTARTSSETVKIIVAGVVTVVTAVIGARVTAPTPEPNKTEIVKSSAEIETEACNRMLDDRMKGECLAGVVRHLTEPRQR